MKPYPSKQHAGPVLAALLAICTVALAPACGSAATPGSSAWPGEPDTLSPPSLEQRDMAVWELMRLDTQLALSVLRERVRQQEQRNKPSHQHDLRQSGNVRLVAIYGVGKRLLAEVMIGEHTTVFLRGKADPLRNGGAEHGYQLQGISGACVRLTRQNEGHTVCLPPSTAGG